MRNVYCINLHIHYTHSIFWTKNVNWSYNSQLGNLDFYAKGVSLWNRHCSYIYYKELWQVTLKEKKKVSIKFSRHQILHHYLFLSNATMYCIIWRSELKEWDRGMRHHTLGKNFSSLSLEMWWICWVWVTG